MVWEGGIWGGKKKEIGFSGQLVGFGAFVFGAQGQAWQCSAVFKPPGDAL